MIYRKSWSDFKALVKSRDLAIEVSDNNSIFYKLYAYDGQQTIECSILKSNTTDVDDFEDNYSAFTNKSPRSKTINNSGLDQYFFNPRGTYFTAPAGLLGAPLTTINDKAINEKLYTNGGIIYCNGAVYGDSLKISIVDKDNILGFGANTVLREVVKEWYVVPNEMMNLKAHGITEIPVPGLYIRTEYNNVGLGTVDVVANLFSLSRV